MSLSSIEDSDSNPKTFKHELHHSSFRIFQKFLNSLNYKKTHLGPEKVIDDDLVLNIYD